LEEDKIDENEEKSNLQENKEIIREEEQEDIKEAEINKEEIKNKIEELNQILENYINVLYHLKYNFIQIYRKKTTIKQTKYNKK
jgi:hypothetical protein